MLYFVYFKFYLKYIDTFKIYFIISNKNLLICIGLYPKANYKYFLFLLVLDHLNQCLRKICIYKYFWELIMLVKNFFLFGIEQFTAFGKELFTGWERTIYWVGKNYLLGGKELFTGWERLFTGWERTVYWVGKNYLLGGKEPFTGGKESFIGLGKNHTMQPSIRSSHNCY